MWFTVVERNEEESQAPKQICVYARAEVAAQIEEATCTISSDHELGDVFENDGLINVYDSRKDGRTSLQRGKVQAQNEGSGSVDTRETTRTTTTPALKTRERTNGRETENGIEMRRKTIDLRRSLVTELQLSNICDDVGNFWRELGPKLEIASSKIQNLDEDCKYNRDKANALLIMWKEQKGSEATAGRLADALESIGRKSIAERLLEMSEVNLPTCVTVGEGHVISLRVLDAKRENKLVLCEDAQGDKYMVKPLDRSDKFWTSKFEERFLKTVAAATQEVEKTTEQKPFISQDSFRRTSTGVQKLRKQLGKVKLDSGGADSRYGVKSFPGRDGTQTTSNDNLLVDVASKVDTPQEQSVEQLLQSCEEPCSFCEGIFVALTKLIGVVAGQIMEDNSKCIQQLWEFTMELRDQEKNFFSRIELARSRSQHLDKHHVARVERLEKWRRAQKEQVEGVEKLLSVLLHQGNIKMERKQSQGKIEKSQKQHNRKSGEFLSTVFPPGLGRRRTKSDPSGKYHSLSEFSDVDKIMDISEPLLVQRMSLMRTYNRFNKERKVVLESQL